MPKLCSWEHQEGTRWQEVQPCFNIATGVVFWVCFFWEDLLGSLCFVESCSATSQRFNPNSAVFFFPGLSCIFCLVLCATMRHEKTRQIQKVTYTMANEVPKRMAFEKDSSLLTTILYARDLSTEWKSSLRPCKDWKQMQAKHQESGSLL